MTWYISALLGTLSLSCMILLAKHLSLVPVANSIILLSISIFCTVLYGTQVIITKPTFHANLKILFLLLLAAVFSYLGNLLHLRAVADAPNPGFAVAVSSSRAVFITIAALFIFNSSLSWFKAIGVCLTILGVIILSCE